MKNGKRGQDQNWETEMFKNFNNCEFVPIIGSDDPDTSVLFKIPPPPLHTILLGPVNHIIDNLKKNHPRLEKILEKLNIQKAKYHGQKFEGNQCRKILQNINKLKIPYDLHAYKTVLTSLRDLHKVCNQELLSYNFDSFGGLF